MNKLFVGAVAAGMFASATTFAGEATADDTEGQPALIVSGTSPPIPWIAKRLYHFDPATRTEIGAKYYDSADANRQIVPYPGTVWPLTGVDSQKVGESVREGADNLDAAIRRTRGPMTVVGLSQGSEVIDEEQLRLANDPKAPPPGQITFVKVSSPQHVLQRAFRPGTHLPYFDYNVPPPVDSQYDTVEVIAEYDVYGDPPDRPGNLLADINSVLGRNHSLAAFSDPANVPSQNIAMTTNSRGATVTTYLVPATELPLVAQLRKWGVPDPVADQLNLVMRPMVDSAYDRNGTPAPPPLQPSTFVNAVNGALHARQVAPAISIPIGSTISGVNAANTALTLASLARGVLSGPKAGPGRKGPLRAVARALLKGKK